LQEKDTTSVKEAPFLYLKGFLMGSADIVPGVSGGTMALIVGIYERLLLAIKSVNGQALRYFFTFKWASFLRQVHTRFLVILLAGIFSAILFFTKVVPLQVYMFTHPEIVYGLFFGLILGSVYILYKELREFGWQHILALAAGIAFGLWVVSLVPTDTSEHPAFVFLSGMIAICAMILPGISGSYLLLILRKYEFVLSELGKLGTEDTLQALITLMPFVVGAVAGLAVFSRVLSWLLNRYHATTITVLIGFLIGSLYVIWPYQQREYVEQVRQVEVVEYNDPEAVALREESVNENLPEYRRLGDVINENAAFDNFKKVEIETVKKKLIHSEPFLPFGERRTNPWTGFGGIFIGLLMVGGLDYLRRKG